MNLTYKFNISKSIRIRTRAHALFENKAQKRIHKDTITYTHIHTHTHTLSLSLTISHSLTHSLSATRSLYTYDYNSIHLVECS